MTRSINSNKPRHRLQRAFFRWLTANRHRLLVPVSVAKRSDSFIDLRLHGINTAILVDISESKHTRWPRSLIRGGHVQQYLTDFPAGSYVRAFDQVIVSVMYKETCWDLLQCIEVSEIHQPDGYTCGLCDPEYRKLYASRAELWEGELFEPFAEWINGKLYPSKWLVLHQSNGSGSTWAKLVDAPPEAKLSTEDSFVTHCLPIHTTDDYSR